jgi:hypothetical protein
MPAEAGSDLTVEIVVPASVSAEVENYPGVRVLSTSVPSDDKLRLGIPDAHTFVVLVEIAVGLANVCLHIRESLAKSGDKDAKALLRSPLESETIEITRHDSEEDIRIRTERIRFR